MFYDEALAAICFPIQQRFYLLRERLIEAFLAALQVDFGRWVIQIISEYFIE